MKYWVRGMGLEVELRLRHRLLWNTVESQKLETQ